MDSSLILTIINLIGKSNTDNLIEKNILNRETENSEKGIIECLKKYKEIENSFEVPTNKEIKKEMENAVRILLNSQKQGIGAINIFDDKFPERLKNIKERSILIFYKGNLSCLYEKDSVGIIGTRVPTENGARVGEALGYYYAKEGFVVVSGAARGCDTVSHRGALKANGKTIAILPCGLDKCYPSDDEDMTEVILEGGGCLISEYVLGAEPMANTYTERDRLIAALSLGVIVVECAIESGTMKTVNFAKDYDKKIAVSMHKDVHSDIDTVKANKYLLERGEAIALKDIDDYKKYKNILLGYKIYN